MCAHSEITGVSVSGGGGRKGKSDRSDAVALISATEDESG